MAGGRDWETLSNALRRANHAFMNDLQVIAGWLQLGNTQRAMEYIEETKGRVRQQSVIMNELGVRLYGLLYALKMKAEAAGIAFMIEDPGPGEFGRWETSPQVERALWRVAEAAASQGFERIELGLGKGVQHDRYVIRLLGGCRDTRCVEDILSSDFPAGFRVRLDEVRSAPAVILERARED